MKRNIFTNSILKFFISKFISRKISEPYTSLLFIFFKSKFFINSRDSLKYLVLNHKQLLLFMNFQRNQRLNNKLTDYQKNTIIKDCLLRFNYYPIQYILKFWFFRKQIFYVNYNVLIPRIETEKIVDICFEQLTLFVREKKNREII